MDRFDFYEFAGIIAPGITFIVCISFFYPTIGDFIQKQNFSLGDFGIIVIISYVIGHLIQGIGNILEKIYWSFWNGMPTDWVRSRKHFIISNGQKSDLEKLLSRNLEKEKVTSIDDLDKNAWASIVNEIYGKIKEAGLDSRVYFFNGNYGLMRGISSVLFLITIIFLFGEKVDCWVLLLLIGLFFLALVRMHRFGKYYARELFVEFLVLSKK